RLSSPVLRWGRGSGVSQVDVHPIRDSLSVRVFRHTILSERLRCPLPWIAVRPTRKVSNYSSIYVASSHSGSQRIPRLRWDESPVTVPLGDLGPLSVQEVSTDAVARQWFGAALAEFHYLGYRGTVGENLQYTVSDASGRLVACLLFGSPAWKCQARDRFIGWTPTQRSQRLHLLTNNTRFLILPWVRVPHLASWALGRVLRRPSRDW